MLLSQHPEGRETVSEFLHVGFTHTGGVQVPNNSARTPHRFCCREMQGLFFFSTNYNQFTKYGVELNPKAARETNSRSLRFEGGWSSLVLPRLFCHQALLFESRLVSLSSTAKQSRAALCSSTWYMVKYKGCIFSLTIVGSNVSNKLDATNAHSEPC